MRSFKLIFFSSFLLCFTLSSSAQFKTKKVRFKDVKSYLFHNPLEVEEVKLNTRIKAGYGLPHGVIGINAETGFNYLSLNAGFGYAKFKATKPNFGFHVGFRGYFLRDNKKLRPRISTNYGLVNIYNENGKSSPSYGPTIGAGFEHKITEFLVYDIEYTFLVNPLNTYRPKVRTLETFATPCIGIGFYF